MNLKVKIFSCIFLFLASLITPSIGMSEFHVAHAHEHIVVHHPAYMNEHLLQAMIFGDIKVNSYTRPEHLQALRHFIENDPLVASKDHQVKNEVEDALFTLAKCGDVTTLLEIDELYIIGSSVVNSEFQKLKYNIQQIIFNKNGEFRGIKNKKDIEKVKKAIEKFEKFMWKWHHNHRAIWDASNEENNTSNKPYKPDWDKQIKNNFYNQDIFRAMALCRDGKLDVARKIVNRYKFDKNWELEHENNIKYAQLDYIVSKFEMDQYCKDKNIIAAQQILDRYEAMYVGRWKRTGENESIVSQHYTNLADTFYPAKKEFISSSITAQTEQTDISVQQTITKMPEILAADIQQLIESEKDVWDEFKTEPRYATRLKSWQESINANKFTMQNYELTPDALNLFKQLGLDSNTFSTFYGNQIQHAIHQEFVDVVNNAGLIYLKTKNVESRDLAKNIITFSDAGSSFLKTGFILKATYTADFCWALLDCGIAMAEGAVQGVKNSSELLAHPIKTAKKLSHAIYDAGYYLGKLLTTLVNDGIIAIKNPEEAATRIEPRIKKINHFIQAIEDKLKTKQPRDIAKKTTEIIVESWCTGKLLSALAKFLKDSSNKFYETMAKVVTQKDALKLAAEGFPVQVRIAEEAINNLMEKTKPFGTARSLEAIKSSFKVAIVGIEEILPEVAKLNSNDIHHILKPKHAWNRLVHDEKDWDSVARIISKILKEGTETPTHNPDVFEKILSIGQERVLVRFRKYSDSTIKVSNSWVIN